MMKLLLRFRFAIALLATFFTAFNTPSTAAVNTAPTTAPKISVVTRYDSSLAIGFVAGSAKGATRYQYTLDGGLTWKSGALKGNSVLVNNVDPSLRYSIALRGLNSFGVGPQSAMYGKKLALFIGASITAGTGGLGNGWARQVSSVFGWQYANQAQGNTGYAVPAIDSSKCDEKSNFASQINCGLIMRPDIVIISGGLNDCSSVIKDPGGTKTRVISTIGKLRTKVPKAVIIVTPVITFSTNSCVTKLNIWLASATSSVYGYYTSGAETWLTGHTEWMRDQIHPNEVGHKYIAGYFTAWLRNRNLDRI